MLARDNKSMREEFLSSDFYSRYKDTIFSDSILKEVFGEQLTKHRFNKLSYENVYYKNLEVIEQFIIFANQTTFDEYTKWLMLRSIYIDPDDSSKKEQNGITCTADGLISLRRMYLKYGITRALLNEYKKYRRFPIIHFPCERNGINMSRASVFGDKIDHTLFDLKRYCEGADDCRLKLAYELPKTKKWLQGFEYQFSEIVKELKIESIFVNEKNCVYDLEKNDGSTIEEYSKQYDWMWSDTYYDSIKFKIEEFEKIIIDH